MSDIEITKREVLASVVIIVVMLTLGIFISGAIRTHSDDKNKVYETTVEITDSELFQYGMRTNVGNAFVEGDYEAVDTVSDPDVDGKYVWLRKDREEYTMHTQTYTTAGPKGTVQTHTRVYWSWDLKDREDKQAKEIKFCGVTFPYGRIGSPSLEYIDTIKEDSDTRYVYRGAGTKTHGSIFTKLKDNTISKENEFYQDTTAKELKESKMEVSTMWITLFWIAWIALTGAIVYGFYALDNYWLE